MQSYCSLVRLSGVKYLRNCLALLAQRRLINRSTMVEAEKRLKTELDSTEVEKRIDAEPQPSGAQHEKRGAEFPRVNRRKQGANADLDLDLKRFVGGVPIDLSDYYFEPETNLRKVRPYFYTYKSSVKRR